MKVALFDPWNGVSGNMILGSLLDAGLRETDLREVLEGLIPEAWTMTVSHVARGGITGTHVSISVDGDDQPARRLADVEGIIGNADLPDTVRTAGIDAFRKLAEAEGAVHGIPPSEVHFHEVGAVDAVLDVVGSFAGLYLLGVRQVYSRPVVTGYGTLECSHGTLPVPAPATLRMLEGVPVSPWKTGEELATPTGVAILTTAVADWEVTPPSIRIERTGMGAGTRNGDRPNLLRVTVGEVLDGLNPGESDTCVVLTAVIDDLDPRIWPVLGSRLMDSGALDCYTAHCTGKKGRPALELTVMCPPRHAEAISSEILVHTSTLGVRMETVNRRRLSRSFMEVATRWGSVSVKIGELDGRIVSAEPEFEDCATVAREADVPVKLVLQEARGLAMTFLQGED